MPRKTKDQSELKETKKDTKETVKKASTTKKTAAKSKSEKTKTTTKKAATPKTKTTATKKASTTKKEVKPKDDKKASAKTTKKETKTTTKKSTTTSKKVAEKKDDKVKKGAKKVATKTVKKEPKTTVKKSTTAKKDSTAKKASTTKKSSTTKKKTTTTKKATTPKKTTTTRKKSVAKKSKVEVVEYYDLPYRYNQTIVKLLAQTPTTLFVYWDISDSDRESFKEKYGENFFETTKPVLIVHNDTLNYSFEVEINDFANSWYLHVSDSKCDYRIELGRRPFDKYQFNNEDYFYVSNSNELEAPNDKILFDSIGDRVFFRDVKTGIETSKSIYNISLLKNMGKIYNIYDLYKAIYKNENVENIYDLYNPSSGNPSSY